MLALEAALPGLQAEDSLRRHGVSKFDPDTVHELVLSMTGDRDAADDAAAKRQQDIMNAMDARAAK